MTIAFFGLLRTWTRTYRASTATTADFVALAEDVAQASLAGLLHAWLDLPQLPPLPGAGFTPAVLPPPEPSLR